MMVVSISSGILGLKIKKLNWKSKDKLLTWTTRVNGLMENVNLIKFQESTSIIWLKKSI